MRGPTPRGLSRAKAAERRSACRNRRKLDAYSRRLLRHRTLHRVPGASTRVGGAPRPTGSPGGERVPRNSAPGSPSRTQVDSPDVRFLHGDPSYDLTYSDVFMVPSRSSISSRLDVDLTSTDGLATPTPLVAANMTAVSGRRMAETMARRGGLAIFPQDIPSDVVARSIDKVKAAHPVFDTAVTVSPTTTVGETLSLIGKRAHGVAVVVDKDRRIVGLVTPQDASDSDRFAQAKDVMTSDVTRVAADTSPAGVFATLSEQHQKVALAVDADDRLVGLMTPKGALRSAIYSPAVDHEGRLRAGVAVGINGDISAEGPRRAGGSRGCDRHGHRPRAPGEDDLRAEPRPGRAGRVRGRDRPPGPHRRRQRGDHRRLRRPDRRRRRHPQGGRRARARCAPRGCRPASGRPQFSAVLECAEAAKERGQVGLGRRRRPPPPRRRPRARCRRRRR